MRTRFAPSPTGYLHIGGARTALYSWLTARKQGGEFVLRIEDTDRERSTEESVQAILDGMAWLGLDYDEGPIYQTQRFDRYQELVQKLLDEGKAYYCYCSKDELEAMREQQMAAGENPRYDGRWRDSDETPPAGVDPVVRFKNPVDGDVVFQDLARGEIRVANTELDDLIIARADGAPTYNFTVVVDDIEMGISHVIRGDDHINNTPRQINIMHALGYQPPKFAHVPMILAPDGSRLSKRHGAVGVMQYREEGYLKEALINYLMRLGWSHGDQEIFSLEEMIQLFDIEDVNRAPSAVNVEKLDWLNQHYMRELPVDNVAGELAYQFERLGIDSNNGPALAEIIPVLGERAKTLVEMAEAARMFYEDFEEFAAGAAKKHLRGVAKEPLEVAYAALQALDDWQAEPLHALVNKVAEDLGLGMGKVGMPLRVAVSGTGMSPSLDVTLEWVGKERTLARVEKALAFIDARIAAEK